jgi:hypothetical protein
MIEPWVTCWSRIIYGKFHHESFNPTHPSWDFPQTGPLSGGNNAIAWMIFERDRERLHRQTNWQVRLIEEIMPFRYLLSGGVSMRNLVPAWFIGPLTSLEKSMPSAMMKKTAMFALIVLGRKKDTDTPRRSTTRHSG